MKKILIGAIGLLIQLAVSGAVYGKVLNVHSPNGTVKVSVELKDKIYYSVFIGDDILLKVLIYISTLEILPSSEGFLFNYTYL